MFPEKGMSIIREQKMQKNCSAQSWTECLPKKPVVRLHFIHSGICNGANYVQCLTIPCVTHCLLCSIPL